VVGLLDHLRDIVIGRRRQRAKDRGCRRRGASEDAIEHQRVHVKSGRLMPRVASRKPRFAKPQTKRP
jgi:hypothetical protein